MKELKHIGLIIDGNGRWGEENGTSRQSGYRAGLERLREVIDFLALSTQVDFLTVYAFSKENIGRPEQEKQAIFAEIGSFIGNHPKNIALAFIGNTENLPKELAEKIDSFENKNIKYDLVVNIAIGYSGRQDIVNAAYNLFTDALKSVFEARMSEQGADDKDIYQDITKLYSEENFARMLSTNFLPPLDLIIRSGGEKRLSNFMLYESAYSELYFIDKLWPDVTKDDIRLAVEDFNNRERRFGR